MTFGLAKGSLSRHGSTRSLLQSGISLIISSAYITLICPSNSGTDADAISFTPSTDNVVTAPPGPRSGVCSWERVGYPNVGCSGSSIDPMVTASMGNLSDACVLWDSSCSGNRSLATENFFNHTRMDLFSNYCFQNPTVERCLELQSQDRQSQFQQIRDWMRSPQCWLSFQEYDENHGQVLENSTGRHFCCETCRLSAEDVEIFYWPEENADTSCLSVVGDSLHPVDYGGTADQYGHLYWGCTISDPISGVATVTTANITTLGYLSIKQTVVNPWGPQPCPSTAALSSTSSTIYQTDSTATALGYFQISSLSRAPKEPPEISSIITMVSEGFTL